MGAGLERTDGGVGGDSEAGQGAGDQASLVEEGLRVAADVQGGRPVGHRHDLRTRLLALADDDLPDERGVGGGRNAVRRELTYVHGHLPAGVAGAHGRREVEGDARLGVRGFLGQIQLEAIEDRREVVGDRLRRLGGARVPDHTVAQTYRTQRPVVGTDVVDGDQVQIERDHRGVVLHLRPGERDRQRHDGAAGR